MHKKRFTLLHYNPKPVLLRQGKKKNEMEQAFIEFFIKEKTALIKSWYNISDLQARTALRMFLVSTRFDDAMQKDLAAKSDLFVRKSQ